MKTAVATMCFLLGIAVAPAVRAEVDVTTPWADVYVGPEGVYVNGPWGRVAVPADERKRVCKAWRKRVEAHYKANSCSVDFDDAGCTIKKVKCDD
jgi:hypothetical protein